MATLYVNASTGDDSRTYVQAQSSSTPWLTVDKALTTSLNGDTIYFAAGTYTNPTTQAYGLQTKQLTIIGAAIVPKSQGGTGYPTTIWTGPGTTTNWVMAMSIFSTGDSSISNIYFQNFHNHEGIGRGVIDFSGATLTVTNCAFKNFRIDGVGEYAGIFTIGNTQPGNLYLYGCAFNQIKRTNPASGTVAAIASGRSYYVYMRNCSIYCNETGGDTLLRIVNHAFGVGTDSFIGVAAQNDGDSVIFTSGDVVTQQGSVIYGFSATPSGASTTSPQFVDPANDIFEVGQSSPCKDIVTPY